MGKKAGKKHKSPGARTKTGYEKLALDLSHIIDPRDRKGRTPHVNLLQANKKAGIELASDWTAQLCLDTIAEVLNDKNIMGRNAFGAKRLARICEAFIKRYENNRLALSTSDEAEVWRTKIDQNQARIFGPDYLHWHERYVLWDQRDTY